MTERQETSTTPANTFSYNPQEAAQRVEEIQQSGRYSMDALIKAINDYLKSLGVETPAVENAQTEQPNQSQAEQNGNQWFAQHPKNRENLTINVIGPQSEQFIRILKSEHPELDVNASVVQWDVVNAAFESGILADNSGMGSRVDYEALKELSTSRWTRDGITQWTHISDLPKDDIDYLRVLLIQEGRLDASHANAGMQDLKNPDSAFRKAATEYGLISSDGSLRPTTIVERDRAYLENTFLNLAPIQVAREQAAAVVQETNPEVIESTEADQPERPAAPAANQNQQQRQRANG